MAVVMSNHGWPWPLGMAVCVLTGTVIGLVIGTIVTRLGIPSFVVTLACFLGLQGVQLAIVGEGGTITFTSKRGLQHRQRQPADLAGLGAVRRRPSAASPA